MKRMIAICSLTVLLTMNSGAEDLLYFCGGRLFGAGRQQKLLSMAECSMSFHDSRELAGFGGSIRKYEEKEPEKTDAITPEFKQLDRYKAVMFTTLPQAEMEGIFTDERIAALREYVKNGGVFIADIRTPEKLGDLLPVTFKGKERRGAGAVVGRPDLPEMSELPESWNKLTPWRLAQAKPGAHVHALVTNPQKKLTAPALVTLPYGKGRVIFYNGLWVNSSSAGSFSTWGYSSYLIRALVSNAIGRPLKNEIKRVTWPQTPAALEKLDYTFDELKYSLVSQGKITRQGNAFRFDSGIVLRPDDKGSVAVTLPGVPKPLVLSAPRLMTSGNPQSLNGDNSEAIVSSYDLRNYDVAWDKISTELKEDVFSVVYSSGQAKLRWEFRPVTLDLDGRKYVGYGDRIVVEKLPILLESVMFTSTLPNGKIRRNTCYTRPRGYLETILSTEEGKIGDSKIWQFFCSGQPFTYLYWQNQGIFAEIVDEPIPCYAQFKAQPGNALTHDLRLLAGRRKAPAQLPTVWHLFSPGSENGNNDYVALYQYARRHLREKCGIKTFPQATQASFYLHKRKLKDIEESAAVAAKLNFKSVWLSYCPLQMKDITGKKLADTMQIVRKYGMEPAPWTPGGYNHKDNDPTFTAHPEWFIRRKDGSFYRYFKELTVGDFNNPQFRQWFLAQIVAARDNGLARVYHDMGGEISSLVNHYPPTMAANANLDGLVLLLREYGRLGIPCSLEGMNPLAKDQALFNPDKAYPLAGKEFAYVGGMPLASVDNGQQYALFFDYFRLLMYNATINIDVDGYRKNFERLPGEMKAMEEIAQLNLLFNEAHAFVDAPFVRDTPFGTAWIGKKSGALFFERGVKELTLHLPDNWQLREGSSLKNIPARSVIFLEKKEK